MSISASFPNYRIEDSVGGVRSLIDNGKSSQANESIPNVNSFDRHKDSGSNGNGNIPDGYAEALNKVPSKPLFNSLAGFALEMGDRLLINGEEVIFKGWVDQSLTAIEVKAIGDEQAPIKQIRAKDIKSLARSLGTDSGSQPTSSPKSPSEGIHDSEPQNQPQTSAKQDLEPENINQDAPSSEYSSASPETSDTETSEEQTEITKEPEYNAWEVWMYLERQRLKTLKLLNTFQAEWEANRFVREAERSAPPTLRVHYEIRPIWLDESTIASNVSDGDKPQDSNKSQDDNEENYADAIDVEIIS